VGLGPCGTPDATNATEHLMQLIGHSMSLHSLPPAFLSLSYLEIHSTSVFQDIAFPVFVLKDDVALNQMSYKCFMRVGPILEAVRLCIIPEMLSGPLTFDVSRLQTISQTHPPQNKVTQ